MYKDLCIFVRYMQNNSIHINQLTKLWLAHGDHNSHEWGTLLRIFVQLDRSFQTSMATFKEDVYGCIKRSDSTDTDLLMMYFDRVLISPTFQSHLKACITPAPKVEEPQGENKVDNDKMAFRAKYALKEANLRRIRPLFQNEMPAEKLSKLIS